MVRAFNASVIHADPLRFGVDGCFWRQFGVVDVALCTDGACTPECGLDGNGLLNVNPYWILDTNADLVLFAGLGYFVLDLAHCAKNLPANKNGCEKNCNSQWTCK